MKWHLDWVNPGDHSNMINTTIALNTVPCHCLACDHDEVEEWQLWCWPLVRLCWALVTSPQCQQSHTSARLSSGASHVSGWWPPYWLEPLHHTHQPLQCTGTPPLSDVTVTHKTANVFSRNITPQAYNLRVMNIFKASFQLHFNGSICPVKQNLYGLHARWWDHMKVIGQCRVRKPDIRSCFPFWIHYHDVFNLTN